MRSRVRQVVFLLMVFVLLWCPCLFLSCTQLGIPAEDTISFPVDAAVGTETDYLSLPIFREDDHFTVLYPDETDLPDDVTPCPYVKAYSYADKSKLTLTGTGEEGAVVTITGGSEKVSCVIEDGVFSLAVPIDKATFWLDITAKSAQKEASRTVSLYNTERS